MHFESEPPDITQPSDTSEFVAMPTLSFSSQMNFAGGSLYLYVRIVQAF